MNPNRPQQLYSSCQSTIAGQRGPRNAIKISIKVQFYYKQSAGQDTVAEAGRGGSNQQRAALGAAISKYIAYIGKPTAICTAYATMRYIEPPCLSKGATHC